MAKGKVFGATFFQKGSKVPFRTRCSASLKITIFVVTASLLAGCAALDGEAPTPTATWFYTAPTLAPTRPPLDARPTESRPFDPAAPVPGQNNPIAAGLPADSELPPLNVQQLFPGADVTQISLSNGTLIRGVLYENPPLNIEGVEIPSRYPGVLLLGAALDAWGDFPATLREAGYTVLVVDMGANASDVDFVAVFQSLQSSSAVDPGAMGVIGVENGADLALAGCALDVGCDAVVLLSPQDGIAAADSARLYSPRPLYIAASASDQTAYDSAQIIAQSSTGEVRRELPLNAGSGLELLANTERVSDGILDFFDAYLILSPLPFDEGG